MLSFLPVSSFELICRDNDLKFSPFGITGLHHYTCLSDMLRVHPRAPCMLYANIRPTE